jgi:hypothetical protein
MIYLGYLPFKSLIQKPIFDENPDFTIIMQSFFIKPGVFKPSAFKKLSDSLFFMFFRIKFLLDLHNPKINLMSCSILLYNGAKAADASKMLISPCIIFQHSVL